MSPSATAAKLDTHFAPYSEADSLDALVQDAEQALFADQQNDGHFVYELEADATIPAEYVMLEHFLDEVDQPLQDKIGIYLRRIQGAHGGWPLFHEGDLNISASVKAYYALKLIGDSEDAPHMVKARQAILDHGGAARANVFTRIQLALYGAMPWHAVPVMPIEIMLLPRWFPFHLDKVAYWSRTVIAPLLILMNLKPTARNPKQVFVPELYNCPPEEEKNYMVNPHDSFIGSCFIQLDKIVRRIEPFFPKSLRKRALQKAIDFTTERLNGEDGIGAIYPAMANAVMAFDSLGYGKDHPDLMIAKKAVYKLITESEQEAYVQPCLSPVWDTCLAVHALLESTNDKSNAKIEQSLDWLLDLQITDRNGDWAVNCPGVDCGGWAFQYRNDHYPDVDDTAVVVMAMARTGNAKYNNAIDKAETWIRAMQSKDGGWGAFDAENNKEYLNHIPFADHGALLDPSTSDVTARCLGMLAQLGYDGSDKSVKRGVDFLKSEQEADGAWFGRWGTNYIYGTWSVLNALNAVGEDLQAPYIRKAVDWLLAHQNADGGWGEDGATYWEERRYECKASTSSQTAWAVLALMAAGDVDHPAVEKGIAYLSAQKREGSKWHEELYTAVGFPKVFYLRYDGYSRYFPLWALARYRNLQSSNSKIVPYGM